MESTTVAYGPHPDQVADVHLPDVGPEAGPVPLVLLLHGGFWREQYDRAHVDPVARALAGRGWCTANVEYRRVGGDGGWPTTFVDVARAVDTLPALVEQVSDGRVDAGRALLAGHSAGGHLALWAGLRHRLPAGAPGRTAEVPRLLGVVALAPAADLRWAHELGSGQGAVADFLGGPEQFPDRFAAADPAALGKADIATVVVHGDQDERLPVEMARRYAEIAGARLIVPEGCGHSDLIDPRSGAWPLITAAMDGLLAARPASPDAVRV
ncbi:alpha/beta hydrolase [Kitasatospora sp. NPDC005856]|uniref:alpha/beta hydrolase family protein n=1 Tax=Kitasatospora sp. NPDC005856 TaxID=3154566 RepID=UPI00340203C1